MITETTLSKLRYPDYWRNSFTLWSNAEAWDSFYFKKNPDTTKQLSRDALYGELNILIRDLESGSKEKEKAIAMKSDLKLQKSAKRKNYQDEKENQLPTKKHKSTITLFCLQKDDDLLSAFPIEIKCKATIGDLKEAIKEKIQVPIAKDLSLWKVEIPDDDEDKLSNIVLDDKERLRPTRKINKYFPEVPVEDHIHVIISSGKSSEDQALQPLELQKIYNDIHVEHLVAELKYRSKVIPISRNEASRSLFASAFLVAATNIFPGKFEVRPEKYVAGPNGHGFVDYGLVLSQTSKLVGIVEVKKSKSVYNSSCKMASL
ncbi:22381_t:CDS:2 [Dentiscutata erythropus]|uniref:22381_t:CDS:1 n=1 Tax=Dentiscutata erythropus TaxID=1348616 RepID=A0A9N9D4B9_9GLOM|nr:22381_t:CDS:2 [Dentiscutata erythropus]